MLKIGCVKWRGKCPKHPAYDPIADGPGAIKGNCAKCNELAEIYELHQRTLRLMRNFHPLQSKSKPAPAYDDLQQSLFA
jgi:hypothetical protein